MAEAAEAEPVQALVVLNPDIQDTESLITPERAGPFLGIVDERRFRAVDAGPGRSRLEPGPARVARGGKGQVDANERDSRSIRTRRQVRPPLPPVGVSSPTGAACRGRETHPAVRIPSTARTAIPRVEVLTAAATQLASMTRRAGSRSVLRRRSSAVSPRRWLTRWKPAITWTAARSWPSARRPPPCRKPARRRGQRLPGLVRGLSLSNWSKKAHRQPTRHPGPEHRQDSRAPRWSSRPRGAGPHWSRRAR